jgi:cobalt-zinc-cadmium resistance protein CzcA
MVNNSISTVSKNLAEGALIVVFVLVLFLGNFRAGFLVASVIPLAMLFAVILMNTFGVSGNLMSLGALDFGLIVDGAVIIVEAVLHQLHSKAAPKLYTQQQMDETVSKSASKMMNSAVFGQVIILIVYLPILSLQGIEGKMFKPMAETVAFALLGAFILSLTYVPMMSAWLLSKKKPEKESLADRLMAKLEGGYRRLLDRILYWPKTVLSTVIAAFALAVYLLSQMGGEFIPSLPEGDFAVETRVLTGSSLQTSVDACLKSQKLLLANFPEIEKVVGKTGSSEIPTDPMPIDASDLMVILKDRSEWTSAHTYEDLAAKMGEVLSAVPGVTYSFQYPVAMRFNELMTGARQDVVCKIFGEDMDTLAHYAQVLGTLCQSIEGAQEVYVEPVAGMPQIVVQYDRAAIAQYGLSIDLVNQALNTAFAGQVAGAIYEGERQFDLVLRLQQEQRRGLADVQQLLIPTPQGQTVPLQNLAKVQIVNGINQIQRENAHRRIIVGFNVRSRDVQSTVQDLQKAVEQKLKLPPGYYIEYGGTFENLAQAKARLAIAVPVALLLIFLLLYFAFGSIKHGLLIYTAIPLSAIGGVLALYLRDMPFSISAGVGFIALFGVAVLNGIVLLAEFNRQRDLGLGDLRAVVLEGGAVRLRPVLMTAFVASLGFLPMALSNGEGAQVQRPLATVVIGGLALATFLTLFVLPILYMMFEKGIIKKALTVLLLLGFGSAAQAQPRLSLQAALDTATQNSMSLRTQQLRADYLQQLKKAAWNLEQTNLSVEMGQLNSAYFDTRLSLGQSFRFPRVYKAQHRLADEQWKEAQWSQRLEQQALKAAVRKVFYEQLYWMEKQKLLAYSDSLLVQALAIVERRLALGESNRLEQTAAQAQRQQVAIQKMQVEQELALLSLQFNWLLQAAQPYLPQNQDLRMDSSLLSTAQNLAEHPRLKQAEQAQSVAKAQLQLAQANRLPNFSIAYNDMSMYGMGADNRLYDSRWTRFRSVQLGVGVPLLSDRAQRAQVKAEELNILRAEAEREQVRRVLLGDQQQRLSRFRQQAQLLAFCERQSLPNAQLILSTAQEQLSRGQINYLEWLLLVNQAIDIRSQYLDLLHQYNLSLIALQEALGL